MATGVGSVIQFVSIWFDGYNSDLFVNNWKYRVTAGELPDDETAFNGMATAFAEGVFGHIKQFLPENGYLRTVIVKRIAPTISFTTDHDFAIDAYAGEITVIPGSTVEAPQLCACFTQKSFLAGRKAIGHKYIGPLPAAYTTNGRILNDPIGFPSLNDFKTFFIAPLTLGTGCTAYPVVCDAKATSVSGANQVRVVNIAEDAVFLRSRRPGKGM